MFAINWQSYITGYKARMLEIFVYIDKKDYFCSMLLRQFRNVLFALNPSPPN